MQSDSVDRLISTFDVSRETLERLEVFDALLKKWNPAINLVSKRTLDEVWTRHILDSAQLFAKADAKTKAWADLGSGGGFPGLVIAILALQKAPEMRVVLIESDQRKATFLRAVVRELSLNAEVLADRIEAISPMGADVVSARALAPLPQLLEYAARHLAPSGCALFPKGATWKDEVQQAKDLWNFELEAVPSLTEPSATILKLKGISRV